MEERTRLTALEEDNRRLQDALAALLALVLSNQEFMAHADPTAMKSRLKEVEERLLPSVNKRPNRFAEELCREIGELK